MTTEQGSRIIAEFMGGNYFRNGNSSYHSDWAQFMPAWFKFRDLKIENIEDVQAYIELKEIVRSAILYTNDHTPAPAFIALVAGIEWYNEIKK